MLAGRVIKGNVIQDRHPPSPTHPGKTVGTKLAPRTRVGKLDSKSAGHVRTENGFRRASKCAFSASFESSSIFHTEAHLQFEAQMKLTDHVLTI